jgi:hypothetical protein
MVEVSPGQYDRPILGALLGGNGMGPTTPSTSFRPPVEKPLLLLELFHEARAVVRMHFDPRFRMSLAARLLPPVLFVLMVLSGYWMSVMVPIPVVGTVIEKIIDLVLAILIFKVFHREVVRYHEVITALSYRR